ncbi:MAG: hypothetical protein WC683_05060 [bacterium]
MAGIRYSTEEIAYMKQHEPTFENHEKGEDLSYAQIALDLNAKYHMHNLGTRTRDGVITYLQERRQEFVRRQVLISQTLLTGAETIGLELSQETLSRACALGLESMMKPLITTTGKPL